MVNNNIDINVIVNGEEQLKNLSVALRRVVLESTGLIKSTTVLDARQKALNAALGHTGRSFNDHAKTLRQAAANQAILSDEIKRTTAELTRLKSLGATSIYNSISGKSIDVSNLEKTSKALKSIKARALISDLRSVGQEMKRLGKDAQFVGRSLIIGLTTPVIAFGRVGLQNFYAIDKQLVRLQKLLSRPLISQVDESGEVQKGLEDITNAATELSYEFGIAKELILGVAGDFAELGINIDESLIALTELVAQFTVLGDMDVTSAKEVTQTLYLGSLAAMEMTGEMAKLNTVFDIQQSAIQKVRGQMVIFNALENATALSMREIAATLPEISAAGLAFGLNFTEMTAILAPMKAIGIDVASAATGIKVSFQKLVNPTIKMQKELKALSEEQLKLGNKELAQDFLDVQGMGIESLQSLVDVTVALKSSAAGSEGLLKFYSQLFDDRQSTRMLTAMKDLASFQEGMFASSLGKAETAQERFVRQINNSLAGSGLFIKDIKSLSEVTTIANTVLDEGATSKYVESLERTVTQGEIDAAQKARRELAEFIKSEQKIGRNAIEDITSEAGKAMAINFAGAANALELADKELIRAKESTSMAIDRIRIAFKNLSASFIQDLAPVIEDVSQRFQDFVQAIQNLSPETKKMIVGVLAVAASLGPFVFIFGQARLAAGVLLENILKLVPGLKTLSATQVAAAPGLQRLTKGLTMQGDTIVNTNSRFATFIATLASGNGPIAKMADAFGRLTGMISKTGTASDDVLKKLSSVSSSTQNAIASATATTGIAGKSLSPAASKAALTRESLRMASGTAAVGMPQIARQQFGRQAGINIARAQAAGVTTGTLAKVEARIASKVTGASLKAAERGIAQGSQQFGQFTERAFRNAIQTRLQAGIAKGVEYTSKGQAKFRGQGISLEQESRIVRGGARGALTRAQIATPQILKGAVTNVGKQVKDFVTLKNSVNNFRNASQSATLAIARLNAHNAAFGMSAPGAFARARVGMMAFTRSVLSGSKAFKILKIAMISTGIGALVLGIAAAIAIVVKNFDKIRTAAAPGIEALKTAFSTLLAIGKALLAPFLDFFAAIAGSDGGASKANGIAEAFNKIAKFIEIAAKAVQDFVNKYVVPLLYNALGAIMNVIKGIGKFIQGIMKLKDNWREGLSMMWEGMKKVGGAILGFFVSTVLRFLVMNAFRVVRLIVMAFTNLGKGVVNIFRWMMKTSLAINTALAKGIVTAFAWLAKTVVNAIRWLVTGTVSLFGAMAKTNIEIIFGLADAGVAVVGFIINAFSLLPRGIGNGIEAAANIFADFIDGIADAVRGTPIIGWLADKAGLVDAARSGADAIRGVGKFIGDAGRDVADFVNGLMDPVSGLVEAGRGAALGLVDGAVGAINGLVNGAADGVNNVIDGIGDGLNNVIDGVSGSISDMIDGTADGINNFLNSLPDSVESAGDLVAGLLEGFGQGRSIGRGAGEEFLDGVGETVEEGIDDAIQDPLVDAGGDAGSAAGEAAGENFLEKIAEIVKDLQQKFVDLVLDSVKGALDEATEQLQEALEKQKEEALKVYDTQIKTIEALEKAEESLTKEKEYQANRRRLIDERELQRANYQRNRALAIYEGRIDDARVLSLEDQQNQKDFQENLVKTDEDRRKDLVKENLDYLKESIKNAKEETEKMLEEQIKAFEKAAKEITKFPPLTIEEYSNQLNQLNDAAKKIAGENGNILQDMMTKMRDKLKMPNENVGVFATGLDELIKVAQQKYGLTATSADNTIVGATIGMLAGINGQIIGNRGSIVAAFSGIVGDVFNTASSFKKISTDIIDPALKDIEKIFQEKNPMKVFEQAFKDANRTILDEMRKTVGHIASAVGDIAKHIDEALIKLAIAQEKASGGLGGGGAGAGGSSGGSTSGGGGGDNNRGDQTPPIDGSPPGSTYQMRIEQVRKGIRAAVESATKPYSNRSYYSDVVTMVTNGLLDIYTFDKYTLATFKAFFSGADEKSTLVRNILSLKPWGGIVTDLNRRYQMVGGYTTTGSGSSSGVGGVSGGNIRYNGGLIRRAMGGVVPGFSSQGVPAILHGGEYIVNAKAVKNIGYAALEAMNNMKYASPGKMSAPTTTTVNETQNINIYVDTFVGEHQWFESMMKEYNLKVVPKNQKTAGLQSRSISTYSGINKGM